MGFDLFDQGLDFEVVLVAALFPVGEVLGVETFASLAEFVDDNRVRKTVIEHAIDHVAGLPGQAGNLAVTSRIG